jgi:hypothetical protein
VGTPGDPGGNVEASRVGSPDLPLIIEQLQNQLDDLREVVEVQQRQLTEQQERLSRLEKR